MRARTAVLPLADFGTVNFTNATVDNAPIGSNANLSELIMQAGAGATRATPSALTGGNAFSVTGTYQTKGPCQNHR